MNRFAGKTVLVTGGASGIGAATVRRLYDEGANVVALDLDQAQAQAVCDEIGDADRLLAVGADVSDAGAVERAFAACVDRFGIPDGLANCAGIRGVGSVLEADHAIMRRNYAVNVEGIFNTMQVFARLVTEAGREGAIVNLSSGAGIEGIPNRLAYVASKHGVVGLTRGAALDLAPRGIRVNAIAPGFVRTPMTAPMFEDPENVKRIRAAHPIGHEGQPEEIASVIAFLLSDDASFVVGAILPVDGGSTAGQGSH